MRCMIAAPALCEGESASNAKLLILIENSMLQKEKLPL